MPIMKSLSVVVMPTHMLPARAAPMAPGTMTAYFDQIEVRFGVECKVVCSGVVWCGLAGFEVILRRLRAKVKN